MLNELPMWMACKTLQSAPKRAVFCTERPDPIRMNPRMDDTLPKVARSQIENALPNLAQLRNETEDPRHK
jgi:hypothetical protein